MVLAGELVTVIRAVPILLTGNMYRADEVEALKIVTGTRLSEQGAFYGRRPMDIEKQIK